MARLSAIALRLEAARISSSQKIIVTDNFLVW